MNFVQTQSRLESGFDLVQTESRCESGLEKIQTLDEIWTSTDDGQLWTALLSVDLGLVLYHISYLIFYYCRYLH